MNGDAKTIAAVDGASWVGRVIDERYRVDAVLGEGGMGAVFAAEHLKLAKRVALKIILPQHAGNAELAQRFAREAMVSGRLEHPSIASALDYGTLPEGGAYLVMQLARGQSLRSMMEVHAGWRLACEVGASIADALATAHARGVVHRDLKPDNVIVERRDDGALLPRVLDFGIARVIDGEVAGQLTRAGTIMGTPGYMAPEQALGDAVDARADVYALGVILWEVTAGRALFDQSDLGAIVAAQMIGEAPRLASMVADAPPQLDDLVVRMLARNREGRPAAAEVREILRNVRLAALGTDRASSMSVIPSRADAPSASVALPSSVRVNPIAATQFAGASAAEVPPASLRRRLPIRPWIAVAGAIFGGVICVGSSSVLVARGCGEPVVGTVERAPKTEPPEVVTITTVPATDSGGLPPEVAADLDVLSAAEDRRERMAAAERLSPRVDALPQYARSLVEMELARSCAERRDIVRALGELGDPRAIPALERLRELPRRGCGPFGAMDCHRCLRRDVDGSLHRLRGDRE